MGAKKGERIPNDGRNARSHYEKGLFLLITSSYLPLPSPLHYFFFFTISRVSWWFSSFASPPWSHLASSITFFRLQELTSWRTFVLLQLVPPLPSPPAFHICVISSFHHSLLPFLFFSSRYRFLSFDFFISSSYINLGIAPGTALYVYISWSFGEISRGGPIGKDTAKILQYTLTYGVGIFSSIPFPPFLSLPFFPPFPLLLSTALLFFLIAVYFFHSYQCRNSSSPLPASLPSFDVYQEVSRQLRSWSSSRGSRETKFKMNWRDSENLKDRKGQLLMRAMRRRYSRSNWLKSEVGEMRSERESGSRWWADVQERMMEQKLTVCIVS